MAVKGRGGGGGPVGWVCGGSHVFYSAEKPCEAAPRHERQLAQVRLLHIPQVLTPCPQVRELDFYTMLMGQ